jgi:solute carrier family 35, member F5
VTWAYAVVLTSPLVVTVGTSTTIPLSIIGQILFNSQRSGILYWTGALVVFISFVFINHESKAEEAKRADDRDDVYMPGSGSERESRDM